MCRKNSYAKVAVPAASWLAVILVMMGVPLASVLVPANEAHAVVGRPATPVSYAGVARRTSRRTVRRTTAAVTALPPGCAVAGTIYTCGAVRYEQVIDGGRVVYVVAD
jgi:hypothetical protein